MLNDPWMCVKIWSKIRQDNIRDEIVTGGWGNLWDPNPNKNKKRYFHTQKKKNVCSTFEIQKTNIKKNLVRRLATNFYKDIKSKHWWLWSGKYTKSCSRCWPIFSSVSIVFKSSAWFFWFQVERRQARVGREVQVIPLVTCVEKSKTKVNILSG